jgi:hypothetical protein
MGQFIDRVNQADYYVRQFRYAEISALALQELLVGLGFYNVSFDPPTACYDSVQYPFPITTEHAVSTLS